MPCQHVANLGPDPEPLTPGVCGACVAIGSDWVHLRLCLECGNVGCCDSSRNKHATAHFRETTHPVMRSAEPGDDWRWCYVDEAIV